MIPSKIRFPVVFIGLFVVASLAALYVGTFGRMERADENGIRKCPADGGRNALP